jgi:uncharacterized Tic20 family protein
MLLGPDRLTGHGQLRISWPPRRAAARWDAELSTFAGLIVPFGSVLLVAALMLVGIPLLVVEVIAWVVLASLSAAKASQGQAYRYPLTMRLVH